MSQVTHEQVLCALEPPETVTPWPTLKTQCRETQYKENTMRGLYENTIVQYVSTLCNMYNTVKYTAAET